MKTMAPVKPGGGTARNSSFELMRILCMLSIILAHFGGHTNWYAEEAGLAHRVEDLSLNGMLIQSFCAGGKWPCCAFALLTGYFTVSSHVHYKRIANLILQTCFYSWLIAALAAIIDPKSLSLLTAFKSLFPFLYGYWFCVYYILFSLFIPFVNRLLHHLSKQEHERLICILLVIWSIVPAFTNGWRSQGNLMMFLTMYVIGAYIRLYAQGSKLERLPWKWVALVSFVLLYGSVFAMDMCSMILKTDVFVGHAVHFTETYAPIAVACAVSSFMLFRQMKFHSKWINWISGSVLGIYLIHEDDIIRPLLWNAWIPNAQYLYSPWLPAFAAAKVAVVFVVCLLLDKGREWLFRHSVDRWLDALWARHAILRADQQASV